MSSGEKIKLNNREYYFTCGAFSNNLVPDSTGNFSDSPKVYPISFNFIHEITINDSLFDPFIDADIILKSPTNFLENTPLLDFEFFANNRSCISFNIQPVEFANSTSFNSKINTLKLFGTICDTDTVASDTNISQLQFIKLIDSNEVSLRETKMSSIKEKINTEKTISEHLVELVSNITGVTPPQTTLPGCISFDYLFPAEFSGYDMMNFLIPYNVVMYNNVLPIQCILKYNYTSDQLTNIPCIVPFLQPSEASSNLETFILGENKGPYIPKVSEGGSPSPPSPTFIPPDNKINNIAYNNVTFRISNEDLVSQLVMNTTSSTNSNSIAYLDIIDEIKAFNSNVVSNLSPIYGKNVKLNVGLDSSKINRKNYKVISSVFDNSTNIMVAKSQLYNSFIFQNMHLSFVTNGQPYREPGKFINITKSLSDNNTNSALEKKILGQWLVTEVKHIISGDGTYKNLIQCVKPFVNK